MSKPIVFRVDLTPVGQPRARAVAVPTGKYRSGQQVWTARTHPVTHIKTPKGQPNKLHPIVRFREAVALTAKAKFRRPMTGPLRVELLCVFLRESKKVWKTRPMHRYWHQSKPDADNVAKAVLDAMTETAWQDDSQVCELIVTKFRCGAGDQPCVIVRVSELPDEVTTWADEFLGERKTETILF